MWYKDPNTGQVIKVLQQYFSMLGKPLKFRSDGGSQFDCLEMRNFLKEYGIEHGQSSPYNPQSNGHAERNVKIVKELLMKTDADVNAKSFLDGIAQIRNTPRTDGISPAQVVFGRSIRTMLPTLTEELGTNPFVEKVRERKTDFDLKRRIRFDQHAKDLKELPPGALIWLQNNDTKRWMKRCYFRAK